jgi:uncharacterized protein
MPTGSLTDLEQRLQGAITGLGPVVVALSGGVDSTLVAVAAAKYLSADQVLCATADSASLATDELELCQGLAHTWGFNWTPVLTDELNDPRYLENNGDRCFWCKTALMDQLAPLATERSATVVLGVNLDDLGDHRPGQHAAAGRGAKFPLVDAGFTKEDIRALAKHWEVQVWDRPAMPCLSSRIPYGTPVAVPLLSRIDRSESALRAMGFSDVRVRHYGDTARIELPAGDMAKAVAGSQEIVNAVQDAGYSYVTLDLAGLRSGNLNDAL